MVKNKKKKVLIGSGIVLILLIASLIGGSLYMLDFSLRPVNRGKDMEGSMAYMRQTYPHIVPWIDSLVCTLSMYVLPVLRHTPPLSYMAIPIMPSVCSISGIYITAL